MIQRTLILQMCVSHELFDCIEILYLQFSEHFLVWTSIQLVAGATKLIIGFVLLGLHVNSVARWNSVGVFRCTSCYWLRAWFKWMLHSMHSASSEILILGCIFCTGTDWHCCRIHLPGDAWHYIKMVTEEWERKVYVHGARWVARNSHHMAIGRLANGKIRLGLCLLCAGDVHFVCYVRLVCERLQFSSRTSKNQRCWTTVHWKIAWQHCFANKGND